MTFKLKMISIALIGAVFLSSPSDAGKESEPVALQQPSSNGNMINIDDYKMSYTTADLAKQALALFQKVGLLIGNAVLDVAIKKLKDVTGANPNKEKPLGAEIRRKQFCKQGPKGLAGCYTLVGTDPETMQKYTAWSVRSCGGLLCGLSDKFDDAIIAVCGSASGPDIENFKKSGCFERMNNKTKTDADRLAERKAALAGIANNNALSYEQRKSQLVAEIGAAMGQQEAAQPVDKEEEIPTAEGVQAELASTVEGRSYIADKKDKVRVSWTADKLDALYNSSAELLADVYLEEAGVGSGAAAQAEGSTKSSDPADSTKGRTSIVVSNVKQPGKSEAINVPTGKADRLIKGRARGDSLGGDDNISGGFK